MQAAADDLASAGVVASLTFAPDADAEGDHTAVTVVATLAEVAPQA